MSGSYDEELARDPTRCKASFRTEWLGPCGGEISQHLCERHREVVCGKPCSARPGPCIKKRPCNRHDPRAKKRVGRGRIDTVLTNPALLPKPKAPRPSPDQAACIKARRIVEQDVDRQVRNRKQVESGSASYSALAQWCARVSGAAQELVALKGADADHRAVRSAIDALIAIARQPPNAAAELDAIDARLRDSAALLHRMGSTGWAIVEQARTRKEMAQQRYVTEQVAMLMLQVSIGSAIEELRGLSVRAANRYIDRIERHPNIRRIMGLDQPREVEASIVDENGSGNVNGNGQDNEKSNEEV